MGAAETGGGGVDARIDFLAGWLAGVASLFVGHPLDTVKTRLQAVATSSHYGSETRTSAEEGRALLDEDRRSKGTREERGRRGPSAFKAVKVMMREEGVRGFYRGVVRNADDALPSLTMSLNGSSPRPRHCSASR